MSLDAAHRYQGACLVICNNMQKAALCNQNSGDEEAVNSSNCLKEICHSYHHVIDPPPPLRYPTRPSLLGPYKFLTWAKPATSQARVGWLQSAGTTRSARAPKHSLIATSREEVWETGSKPRPAGAPSVHVGRPPSAQDAREGHT